MIHTSKDAVFECFGWRGCRDYHGCLTIENMYLNMNQKLRYTYMGSNRLSDGGFAIVYYDTSFRVYVVSFGDSRSGLFP
jgi:hypothetical protein